MLQIEGVEAIVFDLAKPGAKQSALLQIRKVEFSCATYKRMNHSSVCLNASHRDGSICIFESARFVCRLAAVLCRTFPRALCIENRECDILNSVAMQLDLFSRWVLVVKRGLKNQSDVALSQQVLRGVSISCGEIRNLFNLEAKCGRIKERRLFRIPDIKSNMIDVDQGQWICRLIWACLITCA